MIEPCVLHENPVIRNSGIKCLGLYCLLGSEKECQSHLLLFFQILENDLPIIKITTMKILFDLLLLFSNSLKNVFVKDQKNIEESEEKGICIMELILENLKKFLFLTCKTDEDIELLTTAVEGYTKLLFCNIIDNPLVFIYYLLYNNYLKILTQLIFLFFQSSKKSEYTIISQCLSIFFPAYFINESHQLLLKESFILIFQNIIWNNSIQISLSDIIQFLLYCTSYINSSNEIKDTNFLHNQLGILFCHEILTNPSSSESKILCKFLNQLKLNKKFQEDIKTLKILTVNFFIYLFIIFSGKNY